MAGYRLSRASRAKMVRVHPDLIRVVERAIQITEIDFRVTCGTRTRAQQRVLVAKGASRTMNSRHIPGRDGYAKAVDVVALLGRGISWHWPLYHKIAAAFKQAARELSIPIEWGGDWRSFRDGPHFQLPRRQYP